VVLCALAGCDYLFNIDHVGPVPIDAPIIDGVDATEGCRADYETVDGAPPASKYRFVNTNATWENAELDCENDGLTNITHLAVLETPTEVIAVRNYIVEKVITQTGGQFEAHVGYARDLTGEWNRFFAVTGEEIPATAPPWKVGEPNNGLGAQEEPTVRFTRDSDLLDGPTTLEVTYVCECDHEPVRRTFVLH
jgi:hypothetical protein